MAGFARDDQRVLISEADFTRTVIDLAHYRGWLCAHFRPAQVRTGKWVTPMQGDVGYPDLTLARRGVVLHVELKAEKGRLRPEQMAWADQLGESYRLWRPSHMVAIIEELM